MVLVGDLRKAFLLVRIRTADRHAPRFRWRQVEHSHIETLRFTRALYELAPSPLLLGGVIEHHLDNWVEGEPHAKAEIQKSLYVDDLLSSEMTEEETKLLKEKAIEIFEDATFTLHKWKSTEHKVA